MSNRVARQGRAPPARRDAGIGIVATDQGLEAMRAQVLATTTEDYSVITGRGRCNKGFGGVDVEYDKVAAKKPIEPGEEPVFARARAFAMNRSGEAVTVSGEAHRRIKPDGDEEIDASATVFHEDEEGNIDATHYVATDLKEGYGQLVKLLGQSGRDLTPSAVLMLVRNHVTTIHTKDRKQALQMLCKDEYVRDILGPNCGDGTGQVAILRNKDGMLVAAPVKATSGRTPTERLHHALDVHMHGYDSLTRLQQSVLMPGAYSLYTTHLPDPRNYERGKVWLVAPGVLPHAWRGYTRALQPPEFTLVIDTEGHIPGMPIGTATVFNEGWIWKDAPPANAVRVILTSFSTGQPETRERIIMIDQVPMFKLRSCSKAALAEQAFEQTYITGSKHITEVSAAAHELGEITRRQREQPLSEGLPHPQRSLLDVRPVTQGYLSRTQSRLEDSDDPPTGRSQKTFRTKQQRA